MTTLFVILAALALIAVVMSFLPSWELLHKVATLLLAISLLVLALNGAL